MSDAITVPTAAGEELYLWDGFRALIERRAVDIIHPDLLTSGGCMPACELADVLAKVMERWWADPGAAAPFPT